MRQQRGKVKELQTEEQKVIGLVSRLSRFYWSPRPPETYHDFLEGRDIGIGRIAHKNYAAFNVAWALTPMPVTIDDYKRGISYYFEISQCTHLPVDQADLSWYLTSQSQREFVTWYRKFRKHLKPAQRLLDYIKAP